MKDWEIGTPLSGNCWTCFYNEHPSNRCTYEQGKNHYFVICRWALKYCHNSMPEKKTTEVCPGYARSSAG
jgi:hypothetical protein